MLNAIEKSNIIFLQQRKKTSPYDAWKILIE